MANIKEGIIKVGNTMFRTENLKGMTEKQFTEQYKGIISTGVKEAWKQVKKYTKE